jgi:pilus assembly protein Flp/PilA
MNTPEVATATPRGEQEASRRGKASQPFSRAWVAYGQGLVEYALILALIAIVVIGVLTQLGGKTSEIFSSVSCTLDGGTVASSSSNHPGSPLGGGGGLGNNTSTTSTGSC